MTTDDPIRGVLGDDWTHEEMLMALARGSKENGWDEPGMEAYDEIAGTTHAPRWRLSKSSVWQCVIPRAT